MTDISTPIQRSTHLQMKRVFNTVLGKDKGEAHINREIFNIETNDESLHTHKKNKCANPISITELKNCFSGFFFFSGMKDSSR